MVICVESQLPASFRRMNQPTTNLHSGHDGIMIQETIYCMLAKIKYSNERTLSQDYN